MPLWRPSIGRLLPALVFGLVMAGNAAAQDDQTSDAPDWYSIHGQITQVTQYHPSFTSPFRGANSLDPGARGDETFAATLDFGVRLDDNLAFYVDPEIDQGFGLSNTLGIADFPSAQAYKVGSSTPYPRIPSAYGRYTINLGGDTIPDYSGANQVGGSHTADNLTFTVGKFAVTYIFDTNSYAHDSASDFLNWGIVDAGAFDYAADAWGYTYGAAAELTQDWWTFRFGVFDLSREPNSRQLERGFGEFSTIGEFEIHQRWLGLPGKIKFLGYEDTGDIGSYNQAVRAVAGTGLAPNTAEVRKYTIKPGAEINLEQEIRPDLGAFLRASIDDGHKEAYEFTEVNQSLSGGLSLAGNIWHRPDDTVGLAGVISGISKDAQNYLAAGGLGILIGDGKLPQYDPEKVLELYYNVSVTDGIGLGFDYQHVENPGYDPLRGPADILGIRVHGEF